MSEEKPTKVEVGQLWLLRGLDRVAHAVMSIEDDGDDKRAWFDDKMSSNTSRMIAGADWEFHGYAPSYSVPREPGVRAGQRRRWDDGEVFRVLSIDGAFAVWKGEKWVGGDARDTVKYMTERSAIIEADTPSTTPAVPAAKEALCGHPSPDGGKLCTACICARVLADRSPAASPPKPQKRELREVSHNGKPGSWINYDSLTDSDEFRSYKFRRVGGVEVPQLGKAPASVLCVGEYDGARRGEPTPSGGRYMTAPPRSEFIRSERKPWRPSLDDVDLLPDAGQ